MESEIKTHKYLRDTMLQDWLIEECRLRNHARTPMEGDASLRKYFRITQDSNSFVLMDAPPPENCVSFVAIANGLRAQGLQVPQVFKSDIERGFLLLSDLGDMTYLKGLTPENCDYLYKKALDALSILQATQINNHHIPTFNASLMYREWQWHKEWFLEKFLKLKIDADLFSVDKNMDLLVQAAVGQPQVFMHRDFHSANLMVLTNQGASPGILDFQDAFIGPVTYDLVSLLRDCYVDWPEAQIKTWCDYYRKLLMGLGVIQADREEFELWFDWMGLQRHLKALFTFSRKYVRDNQHKYLQHIPRTLKYIITVSAKYPQLSLLHDFYKNRVQQLCEL